MKIKHNGAEQDRDITQLSESQCIYYLDLMSQSDTKDIVFEPGDKEKLEQRLQVVKGSTLQNLKQGLESESEKMEGRNIQNTPQEFVDLVERIRQNPQVTGFDKWLHGNSDKFKDSDQRLDHLNELREAEKRLNKLQPGQKIDLSETPIDGKDSTADLAYGSTLVEVKTVRSPIEECKDLHAQVQAGLSKFGSVTSKGTFHVVVYASYKKELLQGMQIQSNTNKAVTVDGEAIKTITNPQTGQILKEIRENFFAPLLKMLNQGKVPGSAEVSQVDIRMENGKDFCAVNNQGTWSQG